MGTLVEFPSNGATGTGHLATGPDPGPGVIVIQEWWGLVPHIIDVCERYAAAGFTALAPDLYRGDSTSEPDVAAEMMMSLDTQVAAKEMSGAIDFLLAHDMVLGDRVAVTGFCMGGGLSFVLAAERPDAIAAIAPFYGVFPGESAAPEYSAIECAVQGHYAEHDESAPPEASRELENRLRALGVECELFVYEGTEHGFFNDSRPDVYDGVAAAAAWDRTLAFFRAKL